MYKKVDRGDNWGKGQALHPAEQNIQDGFGHAEGGVEDVGGEEIVGEEGEHNLNKYEGQYLEYKKYDPRRDKRVGEEAGGRKEEGLRNTHRGNRGGDENR